MGGYIGSKKSLVKFLEEKMSPYVKPGSTVVDVCCGTGVVSEMFSRLRGVSRITSCDVELYSTIFTTARIKCSYSPKLQVCLDKLNAAKGLAAAKPGNVYHEFSMKRRFFSAANAAHIDWARGAIQRMLSKRIITPLEHVFLLASLLKAADSVASTTSVYASYLKQWHPRALKKMVIKPFHTHVLPTSYEATVLMGDCLEFAHDGKLHGDVVYVDPPYNSRQYGAYYSFFNFLANGAKHPERLTGTGGILPYFKSPFCKTREVEGAFVRLLEGVRCRVLFLSYSNEGTLNVVRLQDILKRFGRVTVHKVPYKRYKSHGANGDGQADGEALHEYLFQVNFPAATKPKKSAVGN